MAALDPALQPIRQSWIDAQSALEDLGRDLDRYAAALEADPEHLAALQERIAALKALERRFGTFVKALNDVWGVPSEAPERERSTECPAAAYARHTGRWAPWPNCRTRTIRALSRRS